MRLGLYIEGCVRLIKVTSPVGSTLTWGGLACPSGPDKMIRTVDWCGSLVPSAWGITRREPSCVGWRAPGPVDIEAGVFARHCGANFQCHKGCLLNRVVLWGTRYPALGGSARPLFTDPVGGLPVTPNATLTN